MKELKSIAFLVTDDNLSGGMNMVRAYAGYLAKVGHNVVFIAERCPASGTLVGLPCLTVSAASRRTFDILVLTFWTLVFDLPFLHALKVVHFIQRLEYQPLRGSSAQLARKVLSLPMEIIAVSPDICDGLVWECSVLRDRITLVRNGIEKSLYQTPPVCPKTDKAKFRVLVEGPIGVSFKGVLPAINAARKGGADEVFLLTSTRIHAFPGVDKVFSHLPAEECAAVYRSCDCLVKMSLSEGMCLPPLEMFHAGGTAVMYALPAVMDYAEDSKNSLLIPVGDSEGIAAGVKRLKKNPELLAQLRAGAGKTAEEWPSMEQSAAAFAQALLRPAPPMRQGLQAALKILEQKLFFASLFLKLKSRTRRML